MIIFLVPKGRRVQHLMRQSRGRFGESIMPRPHKPKNFFLLCSKCIHSFSAEKHCLHVWFLRELFTGNCEKIKLLKGLFVTSIAPKFTVQIFNQKSAKCC